jgi:glycosyltransferase involved in cell wall biosynthesis
MELHEGTRVPNHSSGHRASGRPLKVALVTETYPPEVNGVATTVARIVSGLLAEGHQVQVIRPRQGRSDHAVAARGGLSEVLTRGLPIPRYPELKMGLPARRALQKRWALDRPDVVHLATEGPLGWSALKAALGMGIPVVSEFRTNFHAYSRHYGVGFLQGAILGYLRRFHNQTACTMVPTSALAGTLEFSRFERLQVVGRGVDTELFHPGRRCRELRASWKADDDTLVVLGVGRLAPEKNLGLLCDAFGRMAGVSRDVRLVLVGDGPSREWIQARCPEAILTGRRSGEDLARHFASADVLLFPSLTETFGNVTIEAMASGLGVVAFDYGAAGEVIRSGQTGWLAPYADSGAFLDLAAAVAADPRGRSAAGPLARQMACELGWGGIVAQVIRHYVEAIESGQSATCHEPSGAVRYREAVDGPRQPAFALDVVSKPTVPAAPRRQGGAWLWPQVRQPSRSSSASQESRARNTGLPVE